MNTIKSPEHTQPTTINQIHDLIDNHSKFELELFHGTKNFVGNKIDMSYAGSRRDHQNDARGTGFYMTPNKSNVTGYAGSNGQIVKGSITLTAENISNFCKPSNYKELIQRAVLESPNAFEFFSASYELGVSHYCTDSETYICPETDEEVTCKLDEYLERFGGLKNVFKSRWFKPHSDPSATNPVDDFIAGMIRSYDNMFDCLLNIEAELYTSSCSQSQEDVLLANKLNDLKSEYGIQAGLVEEGPCLVVVITDPQALEVKEVISLAPVNKPKAPRP